MKVLSYTQGSNQIARRRAAEINERRSAAQSEIYWKLSSLNPNQPTNIRCPWKSDRFAMRAWCPLHDGLWVRLIVRTVDDGQHTFECERGCSIEDIDRVVNAQTRAPIVGTVEARAFPKLPAIPTQLSMGAGTPRESTTVLDARHRFPSYQKKGGQLNSGCQDDPAA